VFIVQENQDNLTQTNNLTNCYSRIHVCSKVSISYICPSTINAIFIEPNKTTGRRINKYILGFGTTEVMYLFKFFAEFLLLQCCVLV